TILHPLHTHDYDLTIPQHLVGLCEVLERLLQDTNNINELTYLSFLPWPKECASALHFVAENNQVVAVEILLDHGADINCEDIDGKAPLHHAIRSDSQSVAFALVTRGANVAARYFRPKHTWRGVSTTPLGLVEWDTPLRFLQLLLDAGANITPPDVFDKSSLMLALIRKNDLKTARWLLERLAHPDRSTEQYTSNALICASSDGSAAFVRLLLEYGADINSKDFRECEPYVTALQAATRTSDETKVKLLLDGGIDVDAFTCVGTALHVAAEKDLIVIPKLLLDYHAAIDKPCPLGQAPLMVAILCESTNVAGLLLRHGANPN
ncbi:MAG: hypothetical protein Q9203_007701, partial [Teloschistes exilis]